MKTLAAHGLASGVSHVQAGGKFGAGFLSGVAESYLGSLGTANGINERIGNTIRDAVIGGTVSVIGGDKFANGERSGAYRYLFNEAMTHSSRQVGSIGKALTPNSVAVPGCERLKLEF